ncbi:MAG: hypothetical protein QFB86_00965 [Patescibacteria group bacterium]|nr:hypothetical protein [Patescibacteria group bacterium]
MNIVRNQKGFAMPVIILLIALMAMTAYTVLVQTSNSLGLSYRQSYLQMARVASKAAIDYSQEQFDNATCGNYTGTAEQNMVSNSHYRVTFKSDVLNTSPDGLSKTIQGTGSVYLPKNSVSARYVFSVNSEIVNTFATCKSPDNYSPLLWLDASDTSTLKKVGTVTSSVTPTTSFGMASDTIRDTLEERADDGTTTNAAWQANDLEMHICDPAKFSNAVCTANATKYVNVGFVYSNVNVPKNATITNATITLHCATPSGTSGSTLHRIYGIYQSASNPHPALFTKTGTNQLKTKLATSTLHTTKYDDISENNCQPGNDTQYNVTDLAQEMVNNTNWDPTGTGNGGRMGFGVQYQSGAGSRHLYKDGNNLSISYSTTSVTPANNGDPLGVWVDKSGHSNDAVFAYGTAATRQDNQINAKTVIRFGNGNMLSTLTNPMVNQREMTTFAVVKPNYTTSAADGRVVSGMSTTGTNDTTGGSGIVPLLRNGSGSGISSIYSGNSSTFRTSYNCANCASVPNIFDSRFINSGLNTTDSFLSANGVKVAENDNYQPGNPYTFSIDQLYVGGTRNGSNTGGAGNSYLNGDYAEIIVYDHALSCHQTVSIENYLRSKWNVSASPYADTCPDDVPTL